MMTSKFSTPQSLYRYYFVYLLIAFGLGWFLPIRGAIWGILLMLALMLYIVMRALSHGDKGAHKFKFSAWIYWFVPIMGLFSPIFAYNDIPYENLSVAQGIIPHHSYNRKRECLLAAEQINAAWWHPERQKCAHIRSHDYFLFQTINKEKLELNCNASIGEDKCDKAYDFAGENATVRYIGNQLYELKVNNHTIYDYSTQKGIFSRDYKSAWQDFIIGTFLYSLPLMWFLQQFKYWQLRLNEGKIFLDVTPAWWRILISSLFLLFAYSFYIFFLY